MAVGAHTAPLIELVSNAKVAIDIKYDNISALHVALKAALTEAMTLLDASIVNRRVLAAVDDAMMAAVAPDGLMDQHISKAVTLAVITAVDKIVEREIHPWVQDTLIKIFVSYQDCVIKERKTAESELAASLLAHQASAEVDFQDAIHATTLASIATLDNALSSATAEFKKKQASVVKLIKKACRNLNVPTPVPFMPTRTGLETMADNATPVGATRVAWADAQARCPPAQAADNAPPSSTPTASNQPSSPPNSPDAAAAQERAQHKGAHRLPNPSLRTTPTNLYTPLVNTGLQAPRERSPPIHMGPYAPR